MENAIYSHPTSQNTVYFWMLGIDWYKSRCNSEHFKLLIQMIRPLQHPKKGLEPKNKDHTNFYERCNLTKKYVYVKNIDRFLPKNPISCTQSITILGWYNFKVSVISFWTRSLFSDFLRMYEWFRPDFSSHEMKLPSKVFHIIWDIKKIIWKFFWASLCSYFFLIS